MPDFQLVEGQGFTVLLSRAAALLLLLVAPPPWNVFALTIMFISQVKRGASPT